MASFTSMAYCTASDGVILSACLLAISCAKLIEVILCCVNPNQFLEESDWDTRKLNRSLLSFIVVFIFYSVGSTGVGAGAV